jgi:hypothetical protein
MTNALTISRDDTSEAALAKVHSERSGILARLSYLMPFRAPTRWLPFYQMTAT